MVELEYQSVGLQVCLTWYQTRRKALGLHPRNDGTHTLDRYKVVVAAVQDKELLVRIGFPFFHEVNFLQCCHESHSFFALKIHVGRLDKVMQRISHTDAQLT